MALLVIGRALGAFFLPERGAVLPRPFAIVALFGIALGTIVASSDLGQRIEWQLYDRYMRRLAASRAPAPGIVVVAIDELSFGEVGMAWPWPRSLHAALVRQLARGGARTIAFDIVFDVPGADAAADADMAAAIRDAGSVVLAADQAAVEDVRYAVTQWSDPIEPFKTTARAVGAVRIPYDPDGVLRRAWLEVDGRPSLALAIASTAAGAAPIVEPDPAAARLFRFNGPSRRGVTTVSYYQALDAANLLPAGVFRDKHVLVGRALAATADATADHFMTPVSVQMPGVEVHATILDALLRDGFVSDPFESAWWYLSLGVVLGAAASVTLYFAGPAAGATVVTSLVALLLMAGYGLLAAGARFPPAGPSLAMVGAYAATSAYRFALATRERRMIRRAFQHYVAPAIVEQMLGDPSKLKLGGEQYEVTVLFSDLEGFTTIAEQLQPSELSAQLSEYFREMLDVLLPHQGTLDKLIGDSIMMYFGCPLPDPRHAEHACRAALAMQRQMAVLNDRWVGQGRPPLRTRVGINTGLVVAGNMGTTTIFNYTVLGDCVNLASRLEGVNKEYGTRVIVGEDTWTRVHPAFEGRELDWIRVKGRAAPLAIYELVAEAGGLDDRQRAVFAAYSEGLRRYRDRAWAEALDAFQRAMDADPLDAPSRVLAKRCETLLRHPPVEWDGVARMG